MNDFDPFTSPRSYARPFNGAHALECQQAHDSRCHCPAIWRAAFWLTLLVIAALVGLGASLAFVHQDRYAAALPAARHAHWNKFPRPPVMANNGAVKRDPPDKGSLSTTPYPALSREEENLNRYGSAYLSMIVLATVVFASPRWPSPIRFNRLPESPTFMALATINPRVPRSTSANRPRAFAPMRRGSPPAMQRCSGSSKN